MDFETDPFEFGTVVKPFACGLYDGKNFASVWSSKCAEKMVEHLNTLDPAIVYIHNGGRFDIFFLLKYLHAEMRIINGRIVSARLGDHEIRDSYSIIPVALSQYKKDDIDINKLRRECREAHRVEILSYLRGDCVYLHELVTAFREDFGEFLTIGSAAMNQLRKFHPFELGNAYLDEKFRKQFFFGGRVQCFKSGVIDAPFSIYDVNSMYPHVMKNVMHPTGKAFELDTQVGRKTHFVMAEGWQRGPYGVFPLRNRQGGIDFTTEYGRFACTIHEWNMALETGWFKPRKVIKVYNFEQTICFPDFVDHFYSARMKAKKDGDKIRLIFYKLILNSAYGKFAQNPDNFCDWAITQNQRLPEPWTEHFIHNEGEYVIWKKGITRHSYYNVCIGASITGAARAQLANGLFRSTGSFYCDTDSIICRRLSGVEKSDTVLGAWKLEAQGERLAIAGKKLYAGFDADGECVKMASKGARISPEEIVRVAQGETVTFRKDAPTFKLDGRVEFVERRIRRTV
jgi:DNA polymerase elongation subunit (family B)